MNRNDRPVLVRLYEDANCRLCEALKVELVGHAAAWGIVLESVDIRTDPRLLRQYATRIPVVEVEGIYVLEAPVSPSDVRQAVRRVRRGYRRQRRIYDSHWRWLSRLESAWDHRYGRLWRRQWFERILRVHPPDRPLRGLELAVGAGRNQAFYPTAWTVVGLDVSSLWPAVWKRQVPGAGAVLGDVHTLPFRDASFDLVLSSFTLCAVWHFERVVEEVYRVLRPGGTWWWLDHVRGPGLAGWVQRAVRPLWFAILGCFPDRPVGTWLQADPRFRWQVWPLEGGFLQMGYGLKVGGT
ncbi:MAG: methyltransferase domain-containing protein [Acidobacteria bacterium]|nr:methyltransferase domain-containing protein [Acidobacteriota bacterium]MDW7983937.1 methyltransferase domain-containing protein [Acidobacteriota bacterium]